jgi:osmotically-inducible protein OsmY
VILAAAWPAAQEVGAMMTAEQSADEIRRILIDDPTIQDTRHITISAETRRKFPSKKYQIHLTGTVGSDIDLKKVADIAKRYAGDYPVVNDLTVGGEKAVH